MGSIFQSIKSKRQTTLPVSQVAVDPQQQLGGSGGDAGIRRRLSSLSLKIQQPISSAYPGAAASWAFRRSKSLSSMGEYAGASVRSWWEWGWGWILSRKPTFARDLEMNEEEKAALGGSHHRGSWKHVFYKVRSELRRVLGSDNVGLPQTFRYDSSNYSKNFDK